MTLEAVAVLLKKTPRSVLSMTSRGSMFFGAGRENRTREPLYLEQDIGFEPMTFSLATRHSTTELILPNTLRFLTNRALYPY